jgi:hypothetical protein
MAEHLAILDPINAERQQSMVGREIDGRKLMTEREVR